MIDKLWKLYYCCYLVYFQNKVRSHKKKILNDKNNKLYNNKTTKP